MADDKRAGKPRSERFVTKPGDVTVIRDGKPVRIDDGAGGKGGTKPK